jgi:hypothetical protein
MANFRDPNAFVVLKQGELDYFCGLYCLAMLLRNFDPKYQGDNWPQIGSWIRKFPASPTKGFPKNKLLALCSQAQPLRRLRLEEIEDQDLSRYQYGIAMIALACDSSSGKAKGAKRSTGQKTALWTHYVVFFQHDGVIYIADPSPTQAFKVTIRDSHFDDAWHTRSDDPAWASKEQAKFWSRPGWAIGRPM